MNVNTLSSTWKIDGTPIYTPSSNLKIQHTNQVSNDSGRNESGIMKIGWTRTDIVKINLHYSAMTGEELTMMLNRMQGKEFTFTYVDGGETKTIDAYCGETSYTLITDNYLGTGQQLYKDISMNVIEK